MTEHDQQAKRRIPAFKDRADEAAFWDTHDTTDYEDEFRPVRIRFAQNLSEGITIRLDRETLNTLRVQAKAMGSAPRRSRACGFWNACGA